MVARIRPDNGDLLLTMRSGGEIVDRQMAAPGEEAIRVATRDTTIRAPREELTFG